MASGLKKPTHGFGLPSHWSTSPIETKCVVGVTVVLVVVELVVDDVVVDATAVVVVGIGEVVLEGEAEIAGEVVEGALEELVGAGARLVEVVGRAVAGGTDGSEVVESAREVVVPAEADVVEAPGSSDESEAQDAARTASTTSTAPPACR